MPPSSPPDPGSPADRQARAAIDLEAFARLLWQCGMPSVRPSTWEAFSDAQREHFRRIARRLIHAGVTPPAVERGDAPLSGQLEIHISKPDPSGPTPGRGFF